MIRIERALPGDAETLRQIGVQAFARDTERYGWSPSGIDLVENHWEWMERYHYFKVVMGGEIVGGVLVMPEDDCCHLAALFVAPSRQGQGVGTRVVGLIEEAYPAAIKWALCTGYLSHRAQRFYERLGYREVGRTRPGDYPDVPDEGFYLLLYEKDVRAA